MANPSVILDVSGLVTGISILEDVNNVVIDGLSITGDVSTMEAESQLTLALLMLQFLTMLSISGMLLPLRKITSPLSWNFMLG